MGLHAVVFACVVALAAAIATATAVDLPTDAYLAIDEDDVEALEQAARDLREAAGVAREARLTDARARARAALEEVECLGLPDHTEAARAALEEATSTDDPQVAEAAATRAAEAAHQAQVQRLADARQAFAEAAAAAEVHELTIEEPDADDADALLTAASTLSQATSEAVGRRLAAARLRAHTAREAVARHGEGIEQEMVRAACEQADAAVDVDAADAAADAAEQALSVARDAHLERVRPDFDRVVRHARDLSLPVPEAPDDPVALEELTARLGRDVASAREQQLEAARERYDAAKSRLKASGVAPPPRPSNDEARDWERAAEEAERQADEVEEKQLGAARAAYESAARQARALDLEIPDAPETTAELSSLAASLADLAASTEATLRDELAERWARQQARAAALDTELGDLPDGDLEAVRTALDAAQERLDDLEGDKIAGARDRIASLAADAEALGVPPPDLADDWATTSERLEAFVAAVDIAQRTADASERVTRARRQLRLPAAELPGDIDDLEALADRLELEVEEDAQQRLAMARSRYDAEHREATALGLAPDAPPAEATARDLESARANLQRAIAAHRRQLTDEAGARLHELVVQMRALELDTSDLQRPVGATVTQIEALIQQAEGRLSQARSDAE